MKWNVLFNIAYQTELIYDTIPNAPEENKIIDNYIDDIKSKDINFSKNPIFKHQIQGNVFGKNPSKEEISKIEQSQNINVNSQKILKMVKIVLIIIPSINFSKKVLKQILSKLFQKNNIIESERTNSDKISKD